MSGPDAKIGAELEVDVAKAKANIDKAIKTPLQQIQLQAKKQFAEFTAGIPRGIGIRTDEGTGGAAGGLGKMLGVLAIIQVGIGAMVNALDGIWNNLVKSSPMLQGVLEVLQNAMLLFFKPFGDFLGALFRPMAIWMIRMAYGFNQWVNGIGKVGLPTDVGDLASGVGVIALAVAGVIATVQFLTGLLSAVTTGIAGVPFAPILATLGLGLLIGTWIGKAVHKWLDEQGLIPKEGILAWVVNWLKEKIGAELTALSLLAVIGASIASLIAGVSILPFLVLIGAAISAGILGANIGTWIHGELDKMGLIPKEGIVGGTVKGGLETWQTLHDNFWKGVDVVAKKWDKFWSPEGDGGKFVDGIKAGLADWKAKWDSYWSKDGDGGKFVDGLKQGVDDWKAKWDAYWTGEGEGGKFITKIGDAFLWLGKELAKAINGIIGWWNETFGQIPGVPSLKPISYETGTDFVPQTGMYMLHKGEAVIPASQNKSGGMGDMNITVHVSGTQVYSNYDITKLADDLARQLNVKIREKLPYGRGFT